MNSIAVSNRAALLFACYATEVSLHPTDHILDATQPSVYSQSLCARSRVAHFTHGIFRQVRALGSYVRANLAS